LLSRLGNRTKMEGKDTEKKKIPRDLKRKKGSEKRRLRVSVP